VPTLDLQTLELIPHVFQSVGWVGTEISGPTTHGDAMGKEGVGLCRGCRGGKAEGEIQNREGGWA